MKHLFLPLALFLALHGCGRIATAQNARYDSPVSGSNATVQVCVSPANGVPCSNFATTYNSVGAACPNNAQDTPQPQPSNCQATVDNRGFIGFWAPPGTYDYTVCNGSQCSGPYTITLGGATSSPTLTTSIAVTPSSLGFGTVQTATTSHPQNFTITNTGTNGLVVNSCTFGGLRFTLFNPASCTNILVLPGASLVPQVTYSPLNGSGDTDTLTVNSSAPINPANPPTVALTGTGTASPSFQFSINGGLGAGSGQVTTDDSNISCSVTPPSNEAGPCISNYQTGSTIVVRAIANPGSTFSGFTGTGSASGCTTSPCTIASITADSVLTANFVPVPQTATLNILGGAGQGTGDAVSDVNDVNTGTPINCHITAGVLLASSKCFGVFALGTLVTITETPSLTGVGTCVGGACTFSSFVGVAGCPTTPTTCGITIGGDTALSINFAPPTAVTSLAFVQAMNKQQVAGSTTIAQSFAGAQSAGDTVLINVSWPNNTTTLSSLADTSGNTYTQFATISPATQAGETSVVYCATGIAGAVAGGNTVTATLSTSTSSVEIKGLEYAGVVNCTADDKNVGKATTGTAMDSGAATSTQPNDLLVAFNNVATNVNLSGPSNGQTWVAAIPRTAFGNDAEHILGVPTGAYHNLASQTGSGDWISQIIALKTQTVSGNTASLTIQCAGTGAATITSTFGTPQLNAACPGPTGTFSMSVPLGQSGQINVTPLSGSTFIAMLGGGCGTNASCLTNPITTNTTVRVTTNSSLTGCVGPYSITNQPPVNCPFYGQGANNVTNKRLPADVMSHLATNSDVMAVAAFNAGGTANGFTYPTNWASVGTDDNGNPLYYSSVSDPWYKFGAGCTQTTGIQNGPAFHARNNASFNDTHRSDSSTSFFSDANIRFFDTSTNALAGNYRANNSVIPTTIGSCSATSAGNACQLIGGGACGEAINAFTDADWGSANGWVQRAGNEGSSGLAPMAGIIRGVELINGQINHALILGLSCTDAYLGSFHVFPSPIDTAHCPVVSPGQTNAPANGALFFLDYTDAQINGMGLPTWQKTIITALSHYGGYIDVTTGGAAVGMIVFHESPLPYQIQTGGTITQRTTGGGVTGMYVTGGTPDPINAFLNSAVGCGGTSGTSDCKYSLQVWNNVPNVGGTDITHHMHIADPCIAEGYANQPGACF